MQRLIRRTRDALSIHANQLMLLFGIEGLLIQFISSLASAGSFATNIYATNLGATDSQIGMIQLVANLAAVTLLLPAGVIADHTKNAKTLPVCIHLMLCALYIFYGTVPAMGANRMTFFFIAIALTAGLLATYNGVWQAFFGDVTRTEERNRVFAFRNRMVFIIATIAPVVCGAMLTAMPDSESKLIVLRIFYYSCAGVALLCAVVLSKIPGGLRSAERLAGAARITPAAILGTFRNLASNRRFLRYFIPMMLFYITWHMDWSMWYIGQVRYVGMSEAQLSIYSAACSIGQLLVMGYFVRLAERWGVEKTFMLSVISLVLCPFAMLICAFGPFNRAIVFMITVPLIFLPQCVMSMCMVQMLLNAIPEENRSLSVSLHQIFVTLSNAVMPFLGVQLYTALGGDARAFTAFFLAMALLRGIAAVVFGLSIRKKA